MASWTSMLLFISLVGLFSFMFLKYRTFKGKYEKKAFKVPPGPLGLPILGNLHMLGDLPHHNLHQLAKKYGPVMYLKLGLVPTIVVSSSESAKLFLKSHDIAFSTRPKSQAAKYITYGQKGLVFGEYGSYWRNIRKICTLELFTSLKIEQFKHVRREELRNLVKVLKVAADASEVVDLSAKVGELVEDISYTMIFGSKDDRFNFKPCIQESVDLFGAFNLSDFVPFLGVLDLQGLTRRMKDVSKELDKKLMEIIDEHMQDFREKHIEKDKSFIDILLSLMESNKGQEIDLDLDNVKAIIIDILGASMDTSTNVILWTFSELMRHPRIMKQAQDEVRSVVGMDRMVEETDLTNLEYLNMVIKESMRLRPAIPLIHRECYEHVVIDDYSIRKKSRLLINLRALGRDRDAWTGNVEEFDPNRFANSDIDVYGHDFQLLSFGTGRRICPGLAMGLRVVQLVLATLLHCFNWELPNGMPPTELDMTEKFGIVVSRAENLLVLPTFQLRINL